jgi:hypothetical protein
VPPWHDAPRQAYPPAQRRPAQQPAPRPAQDRSRPQTRPGDQAKNPLIQGARQGRSGSRIGCIVFLIFLGAAFFDQLQSLVNALLDLFR